MSDKCPTCGRPEATETDREVGYRKAAGVKDYPDTNPPYKWKPGLCWRKTLQVWGQSREGAHVDCLTVALDVERTTLAVLHSISVCSGIPRSSTKEMDRMIQGLRAFRLQAIANGVPPQASAIAWGDFKEG